MSIKTIIYYYKTLTSFNSSSLSLFLPPYLTYKTQQRYNG